MGTAQPVLGATARLQGRTLSGIGPGVRGGGQAGNRRGTPMTLYSLCPPVHK